jgi:hypothetical protein
MLYSATLIARFVVYGFDRLVALPSGKDPIAGQCNHAGAGFQKLSA